jgi:hypothetical protein
MDPDSDTAPDPVFSSAADKMPTKNNFFQKLFAYYLLKVHLHQDSKKKSQKEVTKYLVVEIKVFLTFLLVV